MPGCTSTAQLQVRHGVLRTVEARRVARNMIEMLTSRTALLGTLQRRRRRLHYTAGISLAAPAQASHADDGNGHARHAEFAVQLLEGAAIRIRLTPQCATIVDAQQEYPALLGRSADSVHGLLMLVSARYGECYLSAVAASLAAQQAAANDSVTAEASAPPSERDCAGEGSRTENE